MDLVEHLEVNDAVMVLQDQLKLIGLHLFRILHLPVLIGDGVVQINHVQLVLILILDANEEVVGIRHICLAYRDGFVDISNLNSADLGGLISINE
jgi:hypothetical protein